MPRKDFIERSTMKEQSVNVRKPKLNFWTKLAFIAVFILLLVIVIKLNMQINNTKVEFEKIIIEHAQRQLSIEQIKADIAKLPDNVEELDEETLKKIASEELGLRDSDVIIFANSQPN